MGGNAACMSSVDVSIRHHQTDQFCSGGEQAISRNGLGAISFDLHVVNVFDVISFLWSCLIPFTSLHWMASVSFLL